jgi:hypothetical protein
MTQPMTREEALRTIKALPTVYNGVLYDSRAEARWAFFFDQAGIDFIPQPQGFVTDGVAYRPDFLLVPSRVPRPIIAEVKPSFDADPDGVQKLRNLIAARGKERGVVLSAIHPGDMRLLLIGPDGKGETWEDDRGTWLICPAGYHRDVQPVPERGCRDCEWEGDYWYEGEEIGRAYKSALSHRFGGR